MNTVFAIVTQKSIRASGGEYGCLPQAIFVFVLLLFVIIGGISALVILCIWVALFASSFWALLAYVHVFILCCIPLLAAFKLLDMGAKGESQSLKSSAAIAYVHLMVSLTLATFGLVTYILVSGFLLYYSGNYGG